MGISGLASLSGLSGGGIDYLLRDEFTTNLAAGAVNDKDV